MILDTSSVTLAGDTFSHWRRLLVTTNGAGRRGADPYRGKGYADEILLTAVGEGLAPPEKTPAHRTQSVYR